MNTDAKVGGYQSGDAHYEVKNGEDTMKNVVVVQLTQAQFDAAMKSGRIGRIEEIANLDAPPIRRAAAQSDQDTVAVPSGTGGSNERKPGPIHFKQQNPKTIIDTVANFVGRFVFFQDETHCRLVAAWIVATYLHKRFDYLGYLFAYSPERRSGKTTLLEILSLLVYQSTGIQISPTEAVMFRTAEGRTHLLDEVDSWRNKDDLKDVLNAGYKKGGMVTRCDKGKAGFKPTAFPIYAPRVLAGIGLSVLHATTLDRTFALPMVRQKKSEKKERSRERVIKPEAKALRQEIESWVKEHENAVSDIYDKPDEFPYLDSFSDRTIDIAEPLAAIVEVAYKGHPEIDQVRKGLVHAIASTRKEQQSASNDHVLLRHLLNLADVEDPLIGNATELAAQCANLEAPPDIFMVSRVLRNYGFKTRSVRKDGGNPVYRFSLSKTELQEVIDRWAAEPEATGVEPTPGPPEDASADVIQEPEL
jgi:hypothetical protein